MKQEIYIDSYCLINGLMNYVCLYAAGKILFGSVKLHRLLFGSLLGAIYALSNLIYPLRGWIGFFCWGIVLCAMCLIAFGIHSPVLSGEGILLTGLFAFMAGGVLNGLSTFSMSEENKLSLSFVTGIAIATVTVLRLLMKRTKEKLEQKTVRLLITVNHQTKELSALCDSGNLLREPISGFPVILLGSNLKNHNMFRIYFQDSAFPQDNFYVIPIRTASGTDLLYGFRPDLVRICDEKKHIKTDRVILAAEKHCPDFSGCSCLIPTSLL